ncbi:hypothetical protein KC363_g156 [Hortaea werneckii]|nr:hypothetical protein KC363_g156 [Hortaea werneckii]
MPRVDFPTLRSDLASDDLTPSGSQWLSFAFSTLSLMRPVCSQLCAASSARPMILSGIPHMAAQCMP